MSSYTIIQDSGLELRRRIHAALVNTADADFNLGMAEDDITLDPPPDPASGQPLLSLYLYHIEPDSHLRNQKPLRVSPDELRFPPLALQLYYLITALDEDQTLNQLMLGRILQYFHDFPHINTISGNPLGNSFGGNSPEMRVTLETLTLEELSRVWYALSSSYQLSIAYKLRVITIDTAQVPAGAKRTRQVINAVGLK